MGDATLLPGFIDAHTHHETATRSGLAESKFPPRVKQKADLAVKAQDGMVRRALQMGVKIALGTDAAVYPHGNNAPPTACHPLNPYAQALRPPLSC